MSEWGEARIQESERGTRDVKQRIAEAEKAAQEFVKRERQAAEADAEEQRQEVREEVEIEIEEAEGDAEASQRRAEELVEDATEALAKHGGWPARLPRLHRQPRKKRTCRPKRSRRRPSRGRATPRRA